MNTACLDLVRFLDLIGSRGLQPSFALCSRRVSAGPAFDACAAPLIVSSPKTLLAAMNLSRNVRTSKQSCDGITQACGRGGSQDNVHGTSITPKPPHTLRLDGCHSKKILEI